MKIRFICLVLSICLASLAVAETVSVPWEEFKMLYHESVERTLRDRLEKPTTQTQPQVYSIDEAVYRVSIGERGAEGEVLLSGRVLSGAPEPIALFDSSLIIVNVPNVAGGRLMAAGRSVQLLPDAQTAEFQVELAFMAHLHEDNQAFTLSLPIPRAMRNSLDLSLPPGARLLEPPGLADDEGRFHFPTKSELTLRFVDPKAMAVVLPLEIDTLTRIQLAGRRAMLTTHFFPLQAPSVPFQVRLPAGAQYLGSSLKPSWIRQQTGNLFEIDLPAESTGLFSIQYSVNEMEAGAFQIQLPSIGDNTGKQGHFIVEEPDDGRLFLTGDGLVSGLPAGRLARPLAELTGAAATYHQLAPDAQQVRIEVQRFQAVSAPPIVLESQDFFTSFEENGSILSVIVMNVPPASGPRLRLASVQNASIWSLTVNGQSRKVYTDDSGAWIIPLDEGRDSRLELALLRRGPKLGLQGRLETTLPETGLAARTVRVGLALPSRVQLLSLEGPIHPVPDAQWKTPTEFIGKPYYFASAFYKGEGMNLAIAYKEPVKNE